MAKMTFAELNDALDACIEAGEIYNVDFKDWNSYGASRMLEADINEIRARYMNAGKWEERTEEELDLIEALNYSITQFPSKKLMKLYEPTTYVGVAAAVGDLIAKWKPVADKFRTLKPMIVKGRKPADKPRQTPERTLDNTGTCGCCGQNVKMDAQGKLVAHGYTIRAGYQEGNCFGVGYEPVEVSSDILVDYIAQLEAWKTQAETSRNALVENRPALEVRNRRMEVVATYRSGDADYEGVLLSRVGRLEGDVRYFQRGIEIFTKSLNEWAAAPLPGDILKGVAA